MRYCVTFIQNNVYFVDADDDNDAERKAYDEFCSEMSYPVAHTHYDECDVECLDEEENTETQQITERNEIKELHL